MCSSNISVSGTDVNSYLKSVSISSITRNTWVKFLMFTIILESVPDTGDASLIITYQLTPDGNSTCSPETLSLDGLVYYWVSGTGHGELSLLPLDYMKTDFGSMTSMSFVVNMFVSISVSFLRIMISLSSFLQQQELS